MVPRQPLRAMFLSTASSFRGGAFMDAARGLGIEVVRGMDVPPPMVRSASGVLPLDFRDLDRSLKTIVTYTEEHPVQAILSLDDAAVVLAARASAALGLPHNSTEAAQAARDKYVMRRKLAAAGVPSPTFRLYRTTDDVAEIARDLPYPVVVKPTTLAGSQGVIRADTAVEFLAAFRRTGRIIGATLDCPGDILVEDFIPGFEVALEGLLDRGELHVLAIFDKPDPLDGPYFEETIYVTPSRLPADAQQAITECTRQAALALGLQQGPIHAELRVNAAGPWIVEVAGRSIGGLCSKTLRFGSDVSLETLILGQAVGLVTPLKREARARGVMMIPIPAAGLLKRVEGVAEAEAVTGITEIDITVRPDQLLVPLPEGSTYLGFIFAQGESPHRVEAALRAAYARLHIEVAAAIPLLVE
ncbi:MAG: ATP-grasp domain-containing protein [Chloroflexi bacterium]|nr:ATP-grasp domain-containing protein [Chloroflexota bacterium]